MLKNIDPMLNADVLYVLRAMGHGDYIIIADTNFPADAVARETTHGKLLRMDSNTAAHAVESLLSLMPLDTFVDDAAKRMEVVDNSAEIPQVQIEVQQVVDGVQGKSTPLHGVERFEFYDLAKQAYAVIATGERRFYGCFALTKGVIPPDA